MKKIMIDGIIAAIEAAQLFFDFLSENRQILRSLPQTKPTQREKTARFPGYLSHFPSLRLCK
jgi:hypothetical protein